MVSMILTVILWPRTILQAYVYFARNLLDHVDNVPSDFAVCESVNVLFAINRLLGVVDISNNPFCCR